MKGFPLVFLLVRCGFVAAQQTFLDRCSNGTTPRFPSTDATSLR